MLLQAARGDGELDADGEADDDAVEVGPVPGGWLSVWRIGEAQVHEGEPERGLPAGDPAEREEPDEVAGAEHGEEVHPVREAAEGALFQEHREADPVECKQRESYFRANAPTGTWPAPPTPRTSSTASSKPGSAPSAP